MNQKSRVAILGGGGRTGSFVVTELLRQKYMLKVLIRKPESFVTKDSSIEVVAGDALDLNSIQSLLKDCHAVISTIGQRKGEPLVASMVTQNILQVMKEYHIDRYISVAGINVDTPFDKKSEQTQSATQYMKTTFPQIHEDRQKAYAMLTEATVAWTLVRVPMIEFVHDLPGLRASLDDCLGKTITAASIAKFISEQLRDDTFIRRAPFIASC